MFSVIFKDLNGFVLELQEYSEGHICNDTFKTLVNDLVNHTRYAKTPCVFCVFQNKEAVNVLNNRLVLPDFYVMSINVEEKEIIYTFISNRKKTSVYRTFFNY